MEKEAASIKERLNRLLLGRERSPTEPGIFRKLSLVAFMAWIGLGSDGISSSCYGPQEAFLALGGHYSLAIILALLTALTVFIISASYMQIIETFPTGGGSYLVASKLLAPPVGMVAGCALIVDYVLTIAVSIASGSDAVFSFLPLIWQNYKLPASFAILIFMTVLNLRGVKESIRPLVPIFIIFILTHVITILYAIFSHLSDAPLLMERTTVELRGSVSQLGLGGTLFMILHAYSMGGGTYTGIEAVSNGMPFLREPRVETGKRTMLYMAVSLAFIAGGLILSYLFLQVTPQAGKTLNAVLFEQVAGQGLGGYGFVMVALISEALILVVAAQTGFLGGPTILSNMALDGWMPSRFSVLSDHLVTQNGILIMGIASAVILWVSGGSVRFLVVLYCINVFLTFSLSQLGMVVRWWKLRRRYPNWGRKITINGIGLLLTTFLLISVIIVKFHEGGWLTLVITTSLVTLSIFVKRHYNQTGRLLKRLELLLTGALPKRAEALPAVQVRKAPPAKATATTNTAIIMVNGFSGVGLHSLFNILRIFPDHFKNFIFIQIGVIDAGRFKGVEEIENLRQTVIMDLSKYEELLRSHGYYAEGLFALGTDVVHEVEKLASQVVKRFPSSVFFAGQLVFPRDSMVTRALHNYTSFAVQRRLYQRGIPVFILPIRV
ncbi:MAG: APC family permease [Syntrophales bacterium]|nr:APC family permease [Syntrophales bacterium]